MYAEALATARRNNAAERAAAAKPSEAKIAKAKAEALARIVASLTK